MKQKTIIIGFTLFAIFFGAGNLIFPIQLGFDSGFLFWPAIIGFLITGVGMPLLGILACSLYSEGMPDVIDKKIHPLYSLALMVAIYLTIGPLFALPRTSTTSYEIGIVPFFGDSTLGLFIYSFIYFAIVLYFSLVPSRMFEAIGKYLTPILLIFIVALCLATLFQNNPAVSAFRLADDPLPAGLISGYQTMDTIASVAFSMIILIAFKSLGVTKESGLFKYCAIAGLIAGVSLSIVYLGLGWMGNHHAVDNSTLQNLLHAGRNLGSHLLISSSYSVFASAGQIIISVIVFLACLTTAIGLIVAVSGYFHTKLPKINYKIFVWGFTLISFGLSNQGLESVIKGAIPVLLVLYPITIVLICLAFLNKLFNFANITFQLPIFVTTIISILSVLANHFNIELIHSLITKLPWSAISFEWVPPAIISLLIGYLIAVSFKTKNTQLDI